MRPVKTNATEVVQRKEKQMNTDTRDTNVKMTMKPAMKLTQFFRTLYDRLTPSCCRETTDMKRISNSTNLLSATAKRAERVLAKVRQRQLDLALEGKMADSERFARRAHRVRTKAAMLTQVSPCCAA